MGATSEGKYGKPSQRAEFFEELLSRVRAIPGVSQAGVRHRAPITWTTSSRLKAGCRSGPTEFQDADPDYFTSMNIPVFARALFH
jgi:hypothetical protein